VVLRKYSYAHCFYSEDEFFYEYWWCRIWLCKMFIVFYTAKIVYPWVFMTCSTSYCLCLILIHTWSLCLFVCVFVFIPSAQADGRTEIYYSASVTTVKILRGGRELQAVLCTLRQTGTQKHGRNTFINNSDLCVVKQPSMLKRKLFQAAKKLLPITRK